MIAPACTNPNCDEGSASTDAAAPGCALNTKCVAACAAYGRVCPCAARAAGKAAHTKLMSLLKDSHVFLEKPKMPELEASDLVMGEKIGEGGFSIVNSCRLKSHPEKESLAVKFLKQKVMVDYKTFRHGASDLAAEAFFLAQLNHPNIITLHGVTAGSVENNLSKGVECGYFLIVDKLVEGLDARIERWKHEQEKIPHGIFSRMSKEYKETQRLKLQQRLAVALQIAQVMEYLHSLNIVYRDLKPDNMGFTAKEGGQLKLFDFGLAREEKETDSDGLGKYRMTGHTGSRRYMAPEVAKDQPYDKSVDCYSMGILLWELCALEKPFAGYTPKKHMEQVVLGGERPKMDASHTSYWPVALQWLIKSCWSAKSEKRPSMTVIRETLEGILKNDIIQKPDRIRNLSSGEELKDEQAAPSTPEPKMFTSFSGISKPERHRKWSLGFSLKHQ